MTFLEQLQAHKGKLVRSTVRLYWLNNEVWDNRIGIIALVLDVTCMYNDLIISAGTYNSMGTLKAETSRLAAHLLIDGQLHCVRVVEQDVELLDNVQPTSNHGMMIHTTG